MGAQKPSMPQRTQYKKRSSKKISLYKIFAQEHIFIQYNLDFQVKYQLHIYHAEDK